MLDRLFGRNKDDSQEPTCAACGRTLLPGEWAQTVIADDGREEIICSLCAQSGMADQQASPIEEPPIEAAPIPVSGRPQPLRSRQGRDAHDHEDSDAFWRALKDKDARISSLESELARAEAERQELSAQVSLLQRQLRGEAVTDWHAAAPFDEPAATAESVAPSMMADMEAQPFHLPPQAAEEAEEQPLRAFAEAGSEPVAEAEPIAEAIPIAEAEHLTEAEPIAEAEHFAEADAASPADTAEMIAPPALQQEPEAAFVEQAEQPMPVDEPEPEDEVTAGIPLPPAVQAGGVLSQEEGPSWLFDAPPHQTFGDTAMPPELRHAVAEATPALADAYDAPPAQDPLPAAEAAPLFAPPDVPQAAAEQPSTFQPVEPEPEPEQPVYTAEEIAAETLTLQVLQRGADLLNVSPAPRKIAETSESLGVPMAHLSSDGQTMSAVLLWSMAWYEFKVDLSTGDVALIERGYDDRPDLQPNAKARADGTVQIAPPTRRPGAPRPAAPPPPPAAGPPAPDAATRPVAPGNADIISKSLKGQRTDDEAVAWDQMAARDFDWGQ
jgi:hypothetical protein